MQRVRLQGLAVILHSDTPQRPRPPEIYSHRDEHNYESRNAGLNLHVMEKQSLGGFVDDPDTRQQQQAGFDESGKILYFPMAILVIRIRGFVGNPYGKKRDDSSNQVKPGMRSFRENPQAASRSADDYLQRCNRKGGQNRIAGHGALF